MRKLLLSAAILSSSIAAFSVAPYPGPVKYTQPDGSQIEVTMKGNDHSIIYYSTADGQAMLPDAGGQLIPVSTEQVKQALDASATYQPKGVGLHTGYVATTGSPRVCVILVEFKDVKFSTDNPNSYFSRWLNEEGFNDNGSYGSVRDYFIHQSNGQFSPQFDVYGPVTLSSNRSSYASTSNAYKMVHQAAGALDSQVDFSTYDLNGDGNVDNVFVIFAGQGANYGASNSVNPHNSECPTGLFSKKTVDGKLLYHYACASEQGYSTDKPDGCGTFIHEFGHVLGLPDLYNTNGQNDYTPGYWSIMDTGNYLGYGYSPCNYSAYERHACGWLDYTELTEPANVRLRPMTDYSFACSFNTNRQGDYYVLEYRKPTGWDRGLYGEGMLIWHIDASDENALSSTPNNDTSHMRVDLIEADGTVGRGSYEELGGDPWPGVKKNYLFNANTTPALVQWNSSTGSGTTTVDKSISAIFLMTDDNYVQFRYCGGNEENIIDPARVFYPVSVSANPAKGGTVYIGTDQSCKEAIIEGGTEAKLNAVPDDNYIFIKWTHNDKDVAYNKAPAITVTEENQGEYVAIFSKVSGGPEYDYPEGNANYSDVNATTERGVVTLTVSDDMGNTLTVDGPGANNTHPLYVDNTDQALNTEAGATLSFDGEAPNQQWMHSYIYIDFGNDGVFDVDQSDEHINNDLVSHTGYTLSMKSNNSDTADPEVKSDGTAVNMGQIFNLPSYRLPETMTPGTYRLRFKNDWNSTDPIGRSANHLFGGQKGNYMADNGGCVIDLTLNVAPFAGVKSVEVDADNSTAPEYFTIEGIRVNADNLSTGFYIVRQGSRTGKVFITR